MAKRNIFKEAKAYQKLHPRIAWQDAIQKVSKKKTAVKKATTKKRAAVGKKPAVKKVVVRIGAVRKKTAVKRSGSRTISGVATSEHTQHRSKLERYERDLENLMRKPTKGMTAKEKREHAREKTNIRHLISSTKKFMRDLKRAI